jgi:hypothetical protein
MGIKQGSILGLLVGFVMVAAACGASNGAASDAEAPSVESGATMGPMDMGDASLTRADAISDASVVSGSFELLDTAPDGFEALSGTAWLARHQGGTTVTLDLSGLVPDSGYVAHVHSGVCDEAGGPHFRFDAEGRTTPPNEIHLVFHGSADGVGFMTVANPGRVGGDARSVVVHSTGGAAPKVACAELG